MALKARARIEADQTMHRATYGAEFSPSWPVRPLAGAAGKSIATVPSTRLASRVRPGDRRGFGTTVREGRYGEGTDRGGGLAMRARRG